MRVVIRIDQNEMEGFQMSRKKAIITGVTLRVDGGLILPGMPEDSSMVTSNKGW